MTTDERAAIVRALVAELVAAETLHLDRELIAKYTDRGSDSLDRRIVESHSALCPVCAREVQSLETVASRARRRRSWVFFAMIVIGASLFLALTPLLRPSPTIVSLRDGEREVRLTRDGGLSGISNITFEEQNRIANALRGGTLVIAPEALQLASLRPRNPLLAPSGCIVLDDRPTFQWSSLPHGPYRVEVMSSELKPVATGITNTNQWTLPTSLGRGVTYVWRVSALKSGENSQSLSETRFSIVTEKAAEAIHRLEHVQPRSHLALGLAYAEAGITAEAERELSALASENPESADVQRLLRQIKVPSE